MRSAVRVQFWNKNVLAPQAVVVHAEKNGSFLVSRQSWPTRCSDIRRMIDGSARVTQQAEQQSNTRRQMRSAVRVQFWNKNVPAPHAVVVHAEKN
jgi:hypothetical protein